ncbi:MAG: DUF4169 family protein [Pseudomonadota bacterium]
MAEIVNLRRFRKSKSRKDARREADANAARHGATKADKKREAAETEKAKRDLDGHKLEDET